MSRADDLYKQSGVPEVKAQIAKLRRRIDEMLRKDYRTWTAEEKQEFHDLADEYCALAFSSLAKTAEWAKQLRLH